MQKSYFPNLVPRVFSHSWVGDSPACKAAISTPVSPTFWTSIVGDTCTISLKKIEIYRCVIYPRKYSYIYPAITSSMKFFICALI